MNQSMRAALAEMTGMFCFVFIGAGSICTNQITGGAVGLVGIALAHGVVLSIMIASLGHISGGHFNPAVTIALTTTGRCSVTQMISYIGAQLLGAGLAGCALKLAFPAEVLGAPVYLGATLVSTAHISAGQAVWIEGIMTFVLMMAIFGTAVDSRGAKILAPFAIGLVVAVDIFVGGPLTGASMNPARTMGPALVTGEYAHLWVYWVGPVLGALAAAWLYDCLLLPFMGAGRNKKK